MNGQILVIEGGTNTRLGNCLIYLEYLIGIAMRLNREIYFPKLELAISPCFQYQESSLLRYASSFHKSPLQLQAEAQLLVSQANGIEGCYIAPKSHVMIHDIGNNTAIFCKGTHYNGVIDIDEICTEARSFNTVIFSDLFPMKSGSRISLAGLIAIEHTAISPVVAKLQKSKELTGAQLIGIHARRTDYRR